jgi:DNA polymerase-4
MSLGQQVHFGLRISDCGFQSAIHNSKSEIERVVFHVDMNAFFAAIEQRARPSLRGKPIIVCGNPQKRTVVAACSYEAKAYGIKNGMSVFEARRLCPHVVPVAGDPDKYVDIARRLFALMRHLTPAVEIFSIDEAFLDLTDALGPFGGEPEAAARALKRRIREEVFGLTCSIGIGPNKLIAKLASDLHKPDGLVRVRAAEVPALLEDLPVEALCGIGPHLRGDLNDLNLSTCGALGRAPEAALVRRFGVIGQALKRMGQGLDESPVTPMGQEPAAKSMGHAYTLPRDTDDADEIRGTLLRLCEQVARRLRADGACGRTIGLTVRYRDFTTLLRHTTLAEPTDAGLLIYDAARRLLARHCEPLPQRVRLLGVGVSELTRQERQLSCVDGIGRLERLDRCCDAVNDRFGDFTLARAAALAPLVPKSHGFLIKSGRHPRGLVLR